MSQHADDMPSHEAATTTVAASADIRGSTAPAPVVFLDDVPDPAWQLARLASWGRLGEVEATVAYVPSVRDGAVGAGIGVELRRVRVALPLRLSDGQLRWMTLSEGWVGGADHEERAGSLMAHQRVRDAWSLRLDGPVGAALVGDGAVTRLAGPGRPGPAFEVGQAGNRSLAKVDIGGRAIDVLAPGSGRTWSVAAALTSLAGFAGLRWCLGLLPAEVARRPLSRRIPLDGSLRDALSSLLEQADLTVSRRADGAAGGAAMAVVAHGRARRARIPARVLRHGLASVVRISRRAGAGGATRWVARAPGPLVEGTFTLAPAWLRALEWQPDSEYGCATSSDFARYGDVHRLWALNEDGAFSDPVFGPAPAFDLAAFFGDPAAPRGPLPFSRALTALPSSLADGVAGVWLEASLDSGATWALHPGEAALSPGRAAVRLTGAVLPAPFLAAAQAGAARVRITACLRNPRPLEMDRWTGNAFQGVRAERVHELGDLYAWRRVGPSSVFHARVDAGELQADQRDDRAAMRRWIEERARGGSAPEADDDGGGAGLGGATVVLAGAWPWIQAGDRVELAGAGLGAGGASPARIPARLSLRAASVVTEWHAAAGPTTEITGEAV